MNKQKWKEIAQSSSTIIRNQYRLSKVYKSRIVNRHMYRKIRRNRLKEIKTVSSKSGPTPVKYSTARETPWDTLVLILRREGRFVLCLPSPQKLQECSEPMPRCTGFPEVSTAPGTSGTKRILIKNTGELFKSNDENVRNTQRRYPKHFHLRSFQ